MKREGKAQKVGTCQNQKRQMAPVSLLLQHKIVAVRCFIWLLALQMYSGRQADGRQADGRQADGRQADGRQADGRQADGRQADGRQIKNQILAIGNIQCPAVTSVFLFLTL